MKKYFSIFGMMLAVLASLCGGIGAMAATIPDKHADPSGGDPNAGQPLRDSSKDDHGKGVDQQGNDSSASAQQELGFIENQVNDYVTKHLAWKHAMHTDIAREAIQIKVTTPEPETYEVGEDIMECYTKNATTQDDELVLSLNKMDEKLFQKNSTILVDLEGYDAAGNADGSPLMLFVVDNVRGTGVTVSALNGPLVSGSMVVPAIPAGTKLYSMANCLSESEVESAPDNANPLPYNCYLQKMGCSLTYTDLYKRIEKKANWNAQDVKDWVLNKFRKRCSRQQIIGVAKKWTKPGDGRFGPELCYTQEGVLRQLKIQYQVPETFDFEFLTGISSILGGKWSDSDEYTAYCGASFIKKLLNIDFSKHPEVQFKRLENGETKIKFTSYEDNFTRINFKHEYELDDLGFTDCAAIFSVKKAKHFWIEHDTKQLDHNKGEGGVVREAKSEYYLLEECVKLTDMNSMWLSPTGSLLTLGSTPTTAITEVTAWPSNPTTGQIVKLLNNLYDVTNHGNSFPASPSNGDLFHLDAEYTPSGSSVTYEPGDYKATVASGTTTWSAYNRKITFIAGKFYQYNGSKWNEWEGTATA